MAPELFWGKSALIRSDIYALGVVLYQLLAGDFSRPVTTDWAKQIKDPLLREDLEKCFAGDRQIGTDRSIRCPGRCRYEGERIFI